VAALETELGEELYSFAIKNRDLAGPERELPQENIRSKVEEVGWTCLAAWCAALDPALDARVRLKLPPHQALETEVPAAIREKGVEIVRRVMTNE
jgi:hypothetical protein